MPDAPPPEGAVLEVEHYELDDIPLFHLPMAGATILTLAFRVGRADEPVPLGGMTHLFEHLVMNTVSDALDHTNGMTGPFQVSFTLRGTPRRQRNSCATSAGRSRRRSTAAFTRKQTSCEPRQRAARAWASRSG